MGVPGFYRWAVRKVPGVRHKHSLPPWECDNLFLDFNGVIHGCVSSWDGEDEEVIFRLIEEHILMLVEICSPRVLLYVAIDGVAPRAKMNQQRSRRFKAAQPEAEASPDWCGRFDRNAITPGTGFMARLGKRLQQWATAAVSCPALSGVTIVISDDRDPGEGEHKIMEVIRQHPDYVHVLVSADADLVFLGLVSPAEHVFLLRQNQFARGRGKADVSTEAGESPEEPAEAEAEAASVAIASGEYELLSVVAVRKYLAELFPGIDPQRVAADFAAMCCLAGNDFLPHIPALDIYTGGIDRLLTAYKAISSEDHQFLMTESLSLNLPRWAELLRHFAPFEAEALLDSACLGWGPRQPKYRGDGPPADDWDGLSIKVSWAHPSCTSEEVLQNMSKTGCSAVSAWKIRPPSGAGSRAPTHWLVRFADPRSALKTVISQRRIRGKIVPCSWILPSTVQLEAPGDSPQEAAEWKPERDALVLECFEYWFGKENLKRDAFLRRHVYLDPDRFVPIKVFMTFQRMRTLLQDADEIARILRASPAFEVRGDGEDAAVRAVEDFSTQTDETPDQIARRQSAVRSVAGGDFVAAVDALRAEYYARNRGPSVGEPPAEEDADCAIMERSRSRLFLQGIEWVVRYYIQGCSSWSWFFPAHYPPLCTSLMLATRSDIERPPLHSPFPPELQLMAVLPPQSAALLPKKLRALMEPTSPIADLYPLSFEVDRKEEDREWQGIVLLPFVDEVRLRAAVKALDPEGTLFSSFEPPRAFRTRFAANGGKSRSLFQLFGERLAGCCMSREATEPSAWAFRNEAALMDGRLPSPDRARPEVAAAASTSAEANGDAARAGGRPGGGGRHRHDKA